MITDIQSSVQSVALAGSLQKARENNQIPRQQGQTEAAVGTQNNVQKVDFYQQNQETQKKQEEDVEKTTEKSFEEIEKEAEKVNQAAKNSDRTLNFSVEKDTGRIIVKVIDTETDEVIRKLPPEDVKRVSDQFREDNLTGVFLRATV